MTFGEIETVIGEKLPASAFIHRAWWSNNATKETFRPVMLITYGMMASMALGLLGAVIKSVLK